MIKTGMNAPLDKLLIKHESKQVPALDPRWIEQTQFVSYHAPPADISDHGQYEAWMERLKFICDDLHWLLQLPHDRFWCQVVFDETFLHCFDSFLRLAPRSCQVLQNLPVEANNLHNEVYRLVFMACVRMATFKESKECHITPRVFGDILYENFIFDIPKLMDLCVLYGQGNGSLLAKMIDNIFTQQPKYMEDLMHTVSTLIEVFDGFLSKFGLQSDHSSQSPQKLSDHGNKKQSLTTIDSVEFKDVIMYICDIGMTLNAFLEVYPAACQTFHDSDFLMKFPVFYESVIPELLAALKLRNMDVNEKQMLKSLLLQGKNCLLSVFRTIINSCCIQPILETRGNVSDLVEDYLHIMTSILSERRFLADYESLHSFQGDLTILLQASCGISDETRWKYIQDAVNSAFATYGRRKAPKGAMNRGGRRSPDGSTGDIEGAVGGVTSGTGASASGSKMSIPDDAYQVEVDDDLGACAPQVSGVELDSLISTIKDLLPELGDGFVELCLEEMGYDIEKVINGVLEDRLPESLKDRDRTMSRKKKSVPAENLIHQRKNIYDYDEFDVFHRSDIDVQNVRRGKMDKTKDITIGDQEELKLIKSNISRDYAIVTDVVVDDGHKESNITLDVYDDEYDDTYDTNVVGAGDADSADELSTRRPFTTPRVLSGQTREDKRNSSQNYQGSDDESGVQTRDHFIEDPAAIRQAAEEKAKWKAQRSKQPQSQTKKTYDVKGGPKGQGQNAEVLRNRKWKTQHKGDFRRAAADKKRKV